MTTVNKQPVASPCISVCDLNEQEICLGCGRSLQDIADWSAADEPQRAAIVNNAAKRMQSLSDDAQGSGVKYGT